MARVPVSGGGHGDDNGGVTGYRLNGINDGTVRTDSTTDWSRTR